jgi:hypothetical protein
MVSTAQPSPQRGDVAMRNGNGMPRPEPIWIALGIVIFAIAEALEDGRGRRFLDALERRADEHQTTPTVIPFGARRPSSQAAQMAAIWVSRVAQELRSVIR